MKASKIIRYFLPLAFSITVLCGIIYWVVQQDIRIGAYDPQIQMAEDTAASLSSGASPANLVTTQVDISKSLAPFLIVYDKDGQVLVSSAVLNNQTPKLPEGVFGFAKTKEDRFTWEPQSGVREAVVVTSYSSGANSGFILAGRSMREVENREEKLLFQVVIGYLVALVGSFVLTALFI